jgi:hypothetical protein
MDALPTPTIKSHEVIGYYFLDPTEDGLYACKKCTRYFKQQKGSGFTNLKVHLASCTGADYRAHAHEVLEASLKASEGKSHDSNGKEVNRLKGAAFTAMYTSKENDAYKWIEWIIMRNQSLTEVDNPLTREAVRYSPICSTTLKKYILCLIPIVQASIAAALSNVKFELAIDGWTNASIHYVAVFAVFVDVSISTNSPLMKMLCFLTLYYLLNYSSKVSYGGIASMHPNEEEQK